MDNKVTFERFGSYILLERLACGGMAAVYLARPAASSANGRILVVKRILPQIATDPTFLNMFKSETRVCMGFNHPNVVQIFDFGQVDEQPYIAMEYVEGKNLRQLLTQFQNNNQTVPIPVAASIAAQAAAALHHAHTFRNRVTGEALNIIHRDVSPQNILLSYDGNVKVIDFGIAKAVVDDREHTRTATIKGKISYLSPEQVRREPLDPRSDVFSLGAVLWELLTGQKLFSLIGRDDFEIMEKIRNCDGVLEAPSKYNPAVPPALDEIVLRSLRGSRVERYQSAEAMQQALRDFIIASHPGFAYRDVGATMKSTFASEIVAEQSSVRSLNERVQSLLIAHERVAVAPEATAVLSSGGSQSHTPWPKSPYSHQTLTPRPAVVPAQPRGSTPPYGLQPPPTPTLMPAPLPTGARVVQPLTQDYTGSYALNAGSSQTNSQGHPYLVQAGQYSLTVSGAPIKENSRLPKVTRPRVLMAILYLLTIYFLRVDRDYLFFERFFIPSDVVRMAIKTPRQPASLAPSPANQGAVDPSVMLKINVDPAQGGEATKVFVNDVLVATPEKPVKVPVDRKVTVRVERPSFEPYRNEFVLSSADLHGNQIFNLDVKLGQH